MKLAREIAARTEPSFIEIKPEPRRKVRLRATFIEDTTGWTPIPVWLYNLQAGCASDIIAQ